MAKLSYADIKVIANDIGDELFRSVEAGKIGKIGIDEIRAAIVERMKNWRLDLRQRQYLEELTTRRIVEKVG